MPRAFFSSLIENLRDDTSTDSLVAFSDGKVEVDIESDGLNELHVHSDMITGHDLVHETKQEEIPSQYPQEE